MLTHYGTPRGRSVLGGLLVALFLVAPAWGQTPTPELLHYWAFNGGGSAPEAWPPPIPADVGTGFMDHDLRVELTGHAAFAGTAVNAQPGYLPGSSFVPQGSHNNGSSIILHIPTTGYANIAIAYATQRTSSGFTSQAFAYSVDGGETYTDLVTITDLPTTYVLRTVDLFAIPEANDAADLRVRVTLDGATNAQANSRFDNLTVTGTPLPQEPASVQIIHSSPDPTAALVDVYIGSASEDAATLVAGEPLFAGKAFRTATPFTEMPAADYRVVVTAAEGSTPLLDQTVTLTAGHAAQLVVSGTIDPAAQGSPEEQDSGLTIFLNPSARLLASNPEAVEVSAIHGVWGTPAVSIHVGETMLFDSFSYGEVTEYAEVDAAPATLDVIVGDERVSRFRADLSGLAGQAVTLLASGSRAPADSPEGTSLFGLLVVLGDGTAFLLPQVVTIAEARALPLGTEVEVEGVVSRTRGTSTYLQDDTAGLAVRQTYGDLRADVDGGTITTGTRLRVYGITSDSLGLLEIAGAGLRRYDVLGQDTMPEPLDVTLAEIAADGERYEARLVRVAGLTTTASGSFTAGSAYPVMDGTLEGGLAFQVPEPADTELVGSTIPNGAFTFTGVVGHHAAAASTAGGYHLLGILESDIQAEAEATVSVQVIHNAPDPFFAEVDVYINGERVLEDIAFRTATPYFDVPLNVTVVVVPAGSESGEGAVFSETFRLTADERYQLIVTGLTSQEGGNDAGMDFPVSLLVHTGARTATTGSEDDVDLNFVQGLPDAPAVNLVLLEGGVSSVLFEAASSQGLTSYRTMPAGTYALGVTTGDDYETVLAEFTVDFSGVGGQALTALASGFFVPDVQPEGAPSLGLLLVFPDGQTSLIEPHVESAQVSNEASAGLLSFRVEGSFPNPFVTSTTLRYDLPVAAEVRVEVYDMLGRRLLMTPPVQVAPGAGLALPLDASGLAAGTYVWRLTAQTGTELLSQTGRMTLVR